MQSEIIRAGRDDDGLRSVRAPLDELQVVCIGERALEVRAKYDDVLDHLQLAPHN